MANPITGLMHRYHDFTHETGFTNFSLQQVLVASGFSNNDVTVITVGVPCTSILRVPQILLQLTLEFGVRLLSQVYLPRTRVLRSQYIGAIANKND